MTAFSILFTLSAIGIAISTYLVRTRFAHEHAVCPIGGGCTMVLESKYNRLFFIHNDLVGLAFYFVMAFIAGFLVIGVEPVPLWSVLAAMAVTSAAVMSLFLIYLQWRVIKAWCFWCLMSAATVGGMELILLTHKFILS
jgi:uncharacterized membrane protein